MSWAVGENAQGRDVGYGVPSICDHPDCNTPINRGLAYVCGDMHDGGDDGCGLYFCEQHRHADSLCERCTAHKEPFNPKPDTDEWLNWKLTDESWQRWRDENPKAVADICKRLGIWHAAEMPDNALDPDSLVGRMLNVKPTSNEPQIRSSEPLPLWRVMEEAHEQEAGSLIDHLGNTVLGEPDCYTRAAEIEALRDWLLPEEPEPLAAVRADLPRPMIERMDERQRLRAQLTEQARIARGEP